MNTRSRVRRISLICYGALALLGTSLHVWWHWKLRALPEMANLTAVQWAFVDTFNWSVVAICMLFFALTTIMRTARTTPR